MNSSHCHTHGDNAEHTHSHDTLNPSNKDEVIALLSYMINHNKHHTEELHDLSHSMSDEAGTLVHEAIDQFNKGNELLSQALTVLQSK